MSFHSGHREYQRQEAFALQVQKRIATLDEGRGMESQTVTRCQQCDRPTVAEEHTYTPQRAIFSDDRDQTYYTCEWCGAEVTPGELAPRKPAQSAFDEDELENYRRTA